MNGELTTTVAKGIARAVKRCKETDLFKDDQASVEAQRVIAVIVAHALADLIGKGFSRPQFYSDAGVYQAGMEP